MKKPLTIQEAGKLGGEATKKKQGKRFYSKIGQKGGVTTRDTHDESYFSMIGRMGGKQSANNKKQK